jgi:AGCS family alanine or glycine:cation symporter
MLLTGKYNVQNPVLGADGATSFIPRSRKCFCWSRITQSAMAFFLVWFLLCCLHCFLRIHNDVSLLLYAETNISYLTRNLKSPIYNHLLKVLMMVVIMYGSINQAKLAWDIGDLGVGLMAWFNIIAILFTKPLLALKDYEKQRKAGKDLFFNPEDIGVKCPYLEYDR